VRFRRNAGPPISDYVCQIMTYVVEIDARIARHCLHAGRLHAGV
jgi:hypothetical protein